MKEICSVVSRLRPEDLREWPLGLPSKYHYVLTAYAKLICIDKD